MRHALAIVVGGLLAALPFLVYGTGGHEHGPHEDHAPRHGGVLLMIGDHHVEVVDRDDRVELFVSDASRRPLRPAAGRVVLPVDVAIEMSAERHRLVAPVLGGAPIERFEIELGDGTLLPVPSPSALSASR